MKRNIKYVAQAAWVLQFIAKVQLVLRCDSWKHLKNDKPSTGEDVKESDGSEELQLSK